MKTWKVVISANAKADLKDIYGYIAYTLLEPQIAKNQKKRITENIKKLKQFPESFPIYENEPWHSLGLRRFFVNNYTVIYQVFKEKNTVSVVTVIHSRRNIDNVLGKALK
ncbi:MAG: type II toxin-antitoxin system RelE/ParE family toxin [Oscillospiraceae bacterium]|nr:type II toxin-antitoxin system RelE/ParE family toxin [Oscillospiraceae bacterium]